jgi:hypothetical protein
MIQKYVGLGLSVFAMACVPMGADDTASEPSKEPASEPSSDPTGGSTTGGSTSGGGGDPVEYILTEYWAGDLSIAEDGTSTGWESFDLNSGELAIDEYNCQLVWDLASATAAGAECEGCDFSVAVITTPQDADYIVDDGSCTEMFVSGGFGYGVNTNYEGYEGTMVMMYGGGTVGDDGSVSIEEWGGWFISMTAEEMAESPYENTISYDAASGSFSYTYGYKNYEYTYYP